MMKKLALVGACLLAAQVAMAATDLPGVVKILNEQGFDEVEIERGEERIVIEARGNGLARTLVYGTNGKLLSDNVSYIDTGETGETGTDAEGIEDNN